MPHRQTLRRIALAMGLAGALWRGDAQPIGPTVVLPPFIVNAPYRNLPWIHAEFPGYEVLSLLDAKATERFVQSAWQLDRYLDLVAPSQFQFRTSAPRTLILYNGAMQSAISQEMAAALDRARNDQRWRLQDNLLLESDLHLAPNLHLADNDSLAISCVLRNRDFSFSELSDDGTGGGVDDTKAPIRLTEGHLRFLLESRRPKLPDWFVEGVVRLFSAAQMGNDGMVFERTRNLIKVINNHAGMITLQPLLTMEQSLGPRPPPGDPLEKMWLAQAELFVRWAADDNGGTHLPAFWNFVAQSSGVPDNKDLFKQCFGLDHRQMQSQLEEYRIWTIRHRFTLPSERLPPAPEIDLRPASTVEIGRIKGDWERRAISVIRAKYPQYLQTYVDQARDTLMFPYNLGSRDPRLMAAMGQYFCDIGQRQQARPYLEAAVKAKVLHPHIYFELARIYYEDALTHPADRDGKFSNSQVAAIVELFDSMRRQDPPLAEAFELMALAWAHAADRPPSEDLMTLDAGARQFNSPRLTFAVALLEAQSGSTSAARSLIDLGLNSNPDPETKEKLLQAQAALNASGNSH